MTGETLNCYNETSLHNDIKHQPHNNPKCKGCLLDSVICV